MKQFALKITTLSPFSIRSDHSPTSAGVAPYIPGSTLLGCLAAAHQLFRNKETEFVDLFLSNKVQYPNLYPASFKNKDMRNTNAPLYCIPRTAQSCKRFKGFLPIKGDNPNDDKAHGVRDSLFDWALFSLLDKEKNGTKEAQREEIIAPLEEDAKKTCSCREPLDSFDGFYRWGDSGTRALAKAETRLLTRTGINRKYGTVEEQILYSRKVYEEGMTFFGVLRAENDVADNLRKFILDKGSAEYGPLLLTQFARLGTARTRGLGQVAFEMPDLEGPPNTFELFKERLQKFNEALRERVPASARYPSYIALTLQAPTILQDELLHYEGTISSRRLATLTGLEKADPFELLYYTASMQRIKGWQDLWGLPRRHEHALDAGSVFLYAVRQPIDDKLAYALFTLEERGIGQRQAEGFGRISISDPFHREGNLQ